MSKTRKWPTRAIYLFVALALVLSLGIVATPPPSGDNTVAAAPGDTELVVDIERPVSTDNPSVGDEFYVNAVVAYKDIEEHGGDTASVSATINTGSNAALVAGESATKTLTINRNCVGDFWWKVKCTGEGSTTIRVDATATGVTPGSDAVTFDQGEPEEECLLEIEIIEPEGDSAAVPVGTPFVVAATITNNGSKIAQGLEASIDLSTDGAELKNPAKISLPDLYPGDSHEVKWNLECVSDTDVVITVNATSSTYSPSEICEDEVEILQGEEQAPDTCLSVVVEAPEEICTVGCGYNGYEVKATITNKCEATCTNVTATISKTVGASLASIEPPLKKALIDTELGYNESETVSWNVTCTGVGPVTFKVVAQGEESVCTGSGTDDTEQKRVVIKLIDPASTEAEPHPLIQHNICQSFNVTANVTHCDCIGMLNPVVQLDVPESVCFTLVEDTIPKTMIHVSQYDKFADETYEWDIDPAELDDPEKIPFPAFCPCCIYTITWTNLHCCESSGGQVEQIDVKVWDEDGNVVDQDYWRVKQTEKAHLSTGVEVYQGWLSDDTMGTTPIDAVAVGQDFTIVIPVMNMGEAGAEDVTVSYNITGDASCAGTNLTATIDEIEGRSAEKVIIPCTCNGEEDLVIEVIDLAGNDAVKKIVHPNEPDEYAIPEDNLFPCGYKEVQQIPITVEVIEPVQYASVDCCSTYGVKVKVSNNSIDEDNDLEGVTATISWTGGAELLPGYDLEKPLGNIENGHWAEAAWMFHCTSADNADFTITIESEHPAWSDTATATMIQNPTSVLGVERLSPSWASHYGTGEEFVVTAAVYNDGPRTAEGVVAVIATEEEDFTGDGSTTEFELDEYCIGSGSELVWVDNVLQERDVDYTIDYALGIITFVEAPANGAEFFVSYLVGVSPVDPEGIMQQIGNIEPGKYQTVSWTVRAETMCDPGCGDEWFELDIVAFAPCAADANETIGFLIYPAANLDVAVETSDEVVTVGSEFEVTATVTNTGQADASSVKLTIDPGAKAALAAGESATKSVGTLVGWGENESREVTWMLQCEEAGKSTIKITASGNDECGWYFNDMWEEWMQQPGRAIAGKFINDETASTTVEQTPIVFQWSNLRVEPQSGNAPLTITAMADITNYSDTAINELAALKVGGAQVKSQWVKVAGHDLETVTFDYTLATAGTYAVTIDGLTVVTVTVAEPPTPVFEWADLVVEPTSGVAPLAITASADVTNTGGIAGDCTAELKVDGVVVDSQTVTVGAGATETVTFGYSLATVGTYAVTIDGLTAVTVTVSAPVWSPEVYDANDNCLIEIGELLTAINDYIDGDITIEQLLEVIAVYISQTPVC